MQDEIWRFDAFDQPSGQTGQLLSTGFRQRSVKIRTR